MPSPLPRWIETSFEFWLPSAMSLFPSPLKSPSTIDSGPEERGTGYVAIANVPLPIAEKNGEGVVAAIGNGQIALAVSVEIADGERVRL